MWVARAVVPRAVQRDALNTACAAHGTDRLRTRNVHDAAEPAALVRGGECTVRFID